MIMKCADGQKLIGRNIDTGWLGVVWFGGMGTYGRAVRVLACAVLVTLAGASSAYAAGPRWAFTSVAAPRSFAPSDSSGRDQLLLEAINVGGAKAEGAVTITDKLPTGLTAVSIEGEGAASTCTLASLTCVFTEGPQPVGRLAVVVHVDVQPSAPLTVVNEASVYGGGADEVSASDPVQITSTPVTFGIERYDLAATNEDGSADVQAGAHPYELTAEAGFNRALGSGAKITTEGEVKDLDFELPAGLNLDPAAVSQCTSTEFTEGECPNSSTVGLVLVHTTGSTVPAAVYNLQPAPGDLAQFGFSFDGSRVVIDISIRTGGDYGMTASIPDLPNKEIGAVRLVLWGMPSDASHAALRGTCLTGVETDCGDSAPLTPFIALPTYCAAPSQTTAHGDSWEAALSPTDAAAFSQMAGCQRLPFEPEINVAPDTSGANEPTGYVVDLRLSRSEQAALVTAQIRDASVTLPIGTSLSSSVIEGLVGCDEAQIGLESAQPGMCPNASKVGTVSLDTPLLFKSLDGNVYMATQGANPFGSSMVLYLEAQDSGVLVKLAVQVMRDPETGQLTLTFSDVPQLPFSDITLQLEGGSHALLVNPQACGPATTTGELTPWSSGSGIKLSSSFYVTGCQASSPAPTLAPPASAAGVAISTDGSPSSSPIVTAPFLTLMGSKLLISGSAVPVHVVCSQATCQGSIALIAQVASGDQKGKKTSRMRVVLATGSFSIAGMKSSTVVLHLTAVGRKRLARARHHPVAAELVLSVRNGKTITKPVLAR